MAEPIFIYHADCMDGFGAAWSAWKKYGDKGEYRGVYHNTEIPADLDVVNRDVYLLDYVYPIDKMEKLQSLTKSIIILDHHATNQPIFEKYPVGVFTREHSGARIAWDYFHQGIPAPKLIQYVEEGDLWQFTLPHIHEIGEALSSYPLDFAVWSDLESELESEEGFNNLRIEGEAILRKTSKSAEKIASEAELVEFEGHKVLCANTQSNVSEVGNLLVEKQAPFAIVWSRRKNKVIVSLRAKGNIDVSQIAKKFGGGGHPNAASFSWYEDNFMNFLKR